MRLPDSGRESPTAMNVANAVFIMLREHLGSDEEAIRFMREFGGLTLKMPAPEVVEALVRDKRVFVALSRDPSTATVRRLSDHHGVPLRKIAKSFAQSNDGVGLRQVRSGCRAA